MPRADHIAGVVLAGGRSRRMGENKALLDYRGKPLIEHITGILKCSGLETVIISGDIEGYDCVPDDAPFGGPAKAIETVIRRFPDYKGFLFVPVDMPLLEPEMLQILMQQKDGAYFIGCPLPAFITPPYSESNETSVQALLDSHGIYPVDLPKRFFSAMKNTNTPEEWKEVAAL